MTSATLAAEASPSAWLLEGSVLAALARRQRGRVATFDQAFAAAHADVVEVLPG
jgi:hypothetical protein